ncbi:MAG: trypsin-like peptidase domain-containing protein [Pirellulales bacterium]
MQQDMDPYADWLGIEEPSRPLSQYHLLGLSLFEDDRQAIEQAAKDQLLKLEAHLAGQHARLARRTVLEIEAAKSCLLDPAAKEAYDNALLRQSGALPSRRRAVDNPKNNHLADLVLSEPPPPGPQLAPAGPPSPARRAPPPRDGATVVRITPKAMRRLVLVAACLMLALVVGLWALIDSSPRLANVPDRAGAPVAGELTLGGGSVAPPLPMSAPPQTWLPPQSTPSPVEIPPEPSGLDTEKLLRQAGASVVVLHVVTAAGREKGLGFLVDEQGTVATTFHLIEEAVSATAVFPNRRTAAVSGYVALEGRKNLALLSMDSPQPGPPPLALAAARVGEPVLVLSTDRFPVRASQGTIAALLGGDELRQQLQAAARRVRYRLHGLDTSAGWVGATVPIGLGDSGAPIVNARGEVVAMAAWGAEDGLPQTLAISSAAIVELMARRSAVRVRLSALPRAGSFGQVALDSGSALTDQMVNINPAEVQRLKSGSGAEQEFGPFMQLYPNGETGGLFGYQKGLLHGPSVTSYLNKQPMIVAFYEEARRDGPLRIWNEEGRVVFYAQYKRGRPDGLMCLFRRGLPWLVQEHVLGTLKARYLVDFSTGQAAVSLVGVALGAADGDELQAGLAQLAALEERMVEGENLLKRELLQWYRDEDKLLKQDRVSQLAPAKRLERAKRRSARAAANDARMRELWRMALAIGT